ncbi:PIN domain-containing protein [Xanthomonas campestris pv. campestris]|uniref:type II toxin-antitoxin system VapC family toxin n=1 Tax=Xanthomonas campestris TaxID=339 RepID=UPI0023680416|nr:PIN domain-containing protein [Xanthomonas campestris]WDJ86917.1 PIN domain-containing protein [Xanthomonas campestris pv. incanae]WDJ95650.1 PIN domain-containing protein [Xanthomonas campestris pv. incanae]WDK23966.1 PIN domain-containing protein [Xanthomonas campestris pv. incanae]
MTRLVLLDANLLIGALDGEEGNAAHEASLSTFEALVADPDVKIAISPLIRYEVLRGMDEADVEAVNAILNDMKEFEVRGQEAIRAAEVFRRARQTNVKLDKCKFDVFHCVCAEINELEMLSKDGDIETIQNLMKA